MKFGRNPDGFFRGPGAGHSAVFVPHPSATGFPQVVADRLGVLEENELYLFFFFFN